MDTRVAVFLFADVLRKPVQFFLFFKERSSLHLNMRIVHVRLK